MKWFPLLWAALRRRPARTIFTFLSIVVAFLLVGIMSGLNAAFAERIENARLDRIVVTARYGVWFPIADLDQLSGSIRLKVCFFHELRFVTKDAKSQNFVTEIAFWLQF